MIILTIAKAGILWNPTKGNGLPAAEKLSELLMAQGCALCADDKLAIILGCETISSAHDPECDVLFVLGGDGTLLSALDYAVPYRIPMLGINLGRVGFLAEIKPCELEQSLEAIYDDRFTFEDRMLMSVKGMENDYFALNEIVVSRRTAAAGVLSIETEVRGAMIDRLSGDGLIIASATGSTAYSLSAGGPIVAPGLDCFVMTPICPHTMNARPVVASAAEEIVVRVIDKPNDACAVFDGRRILELSSKNPEITIVRSTQNARFIRLREHNYFELLRKKLSEWTH